MTDYTFAIGTIVFMAGWIAADTFTINRAVKRIEKMLKEKR